MTVIAATIERKRQRNVAWRESNLEPGPYLGSLCKRGHDAGNGKSLRGPQNHSCLECAKMASLRARYGITEAEYRALLESQGGCCAVCGESKQDKRSWRRLGLDHRHIDGKWRGILCGACNRALGFLRDDPLLIEKLAAYARKHQ